MPSTDLIRNELLEAVREELDKATQTIRHCLNQLSDAQMSWRPDASMNSIGNLVLHLCGNLRQWIVSGVGGELDVRQRPEEFADHGTFSKQELLDQLDQMVEKSDRLLASVPSALLLEERRVQGFPTTCLAAIISSIVHFKGHSQEIVCLTRMQLGDDYEFEWVPTTREEGAPD